MKDYRPEIGKGFARLILCAVAGLVLSLGGLQAQTGKRPLPGVFKQSIAGSGPIKQSVQSAWSAFRAEHGAETTAMWSEKTGLPTSLSDFAVALGAGDRRQAAKNFINDHRSLLLHDETADSLELLSTRESAAGTHVDFRQTYQGIPVHRAVLSVHMADNAVTMLNGSYFPNLEIDTLPKFSAESALAAIQDDFGAEVRMGKVSQGPELVVYPQGTTTRLCWLVKLSTWSPFGAWEVLVDAHTNQVVQKNNLVKSATGRGVVYTENPFTTPEAVVRPFDYLDESGELRGSFARVGQYDPGLDDLRHTAVSSNLDFFFFPDDPRFAEQHVYYHINVIHDYFKSRFGFTGRDAQLPVAVNFPDPETGGPMDNALFIGSPDFEALLFGAGSGAENGRFNNLAYDADVVYHEYAHAVIYRINDRLGESDEFDFGGAMNEGYSDYFACSFFDDGELGEWSKQRSTGLRNLANTNRLPEDFNDPQINAPEVHHTGLIWGGALWDLRTVLGAEVADQIIFQSLYFLPQDGTANFQNGLQALIAADNVLFRGVHRLTITRKLNARGIFAVGSAPIDEVTLPVVYAPSGVTGSSVLVTEMTLSNPGAESAIVEFTYTSALGSGGGTATDRLDAGEQRRIPNAIAYLREIGIDIPDSGSVAGTVLIRFSSPGCQVTAQNVVRR